MYVCHVFAMFSAANVSGSGSGWEEEGRRGGGDEDMRRVLCCLVAGSAQVWGWRRVIQDVGD